jgi:ribosome-binding protein aMBF1 (putative translation factor)
MSKPAYSHQDWNPVVFHKAKEGAEAKAREIKKSTLAPKETRRLNDDTNEDYHPLKFEKEFLQEIIQARIQRQWTQKDLAMALKEPVNRIQSLEQGKEVYDSNLKAKLKRTLFPAKPSGNKEDLKKSS